MVRGQTAIEFIILFGFLLFVFTMFALAVQQRTSALAIQGQRAELAAIVETVDVEVTQAYMVQDGYARQFELPALANGQQYSVTIAAQRELTVRTPDQEYLRFLAVNVTVNGQPSGALR